MTYVTKFNPFTGNMQWVNDYRAGDTYYSWVSLDPRMHSATVAVGATTYFHPGYHQMLDISQYVDGQHFYACGYIELPVGWRCKVIGWRGSSYQSYTDASNYVKWITGIMSVVDINHATDTRTSTTLKTLTDPFGAPDANGVYAGYNATDFVERWLYTYDDDSTQVLNELNLRYTVKEVGDPTGYDNLYMYSHALKVQYEKL